VSTTHRRFEGTRGGEERGWLAVRSGVACAEVQSTARARDPHRTTRGTTGVVQSVPHSRAASESINTKLKTGNQMRWRCESSLRTHRRRRLGLGFGLHVLLRHRGEMGRAREKAGASWVWRLGESRVGFTEGW